VERQHRQDEARFYKQMRMYNLEDGRKQLAVYQKKSNNYIKTCLGMRSPNTVVKNGIKNDYVLELAKGRQHRVLPP